MPTTNFNLAIVISRFNEEITEKLHQSAMDRLKELNVESERVTTVWVPGAIEIPITAQRLAETGRFEVIVCLGAVVYGETKHFDYVCQQVSFGCQEVALSHDIPVIFGVLTTNDMEQAYARVSKGRESIDTAFDLVQTLRQIEKE